MIKNYKLLITTNNVEQNRTSFWFRYTICGRFKQFFFQKRKLQILPLPQTNYCNFNLGFWGGANNHAAFMEVYQTKL